MAIQRRQTRLVDVATRAGVSPTAAGKVLSGTGGDRVAVSPGVAERIRAAAEELKYRPNLAARQLRGERSRMIGVLVDAFANQDVFTRLGFMEEQLRARGYRMMIGQGHEDGRAFEEYEQEFISRGVEGAMCLSHDYHKADLGRSLAKLFDRPQLPAVLVGQPAVEARHASVVHIDRKTGIRLALDHIFATGRHDPGIVLFDSESKSMQARTEGFCEALQERGFTDAEQRIARIPYENVMKQIPDLGEFVKTTLLPKGHDALLAVNDEVAARLVRALQASGRRVPEDVAVVGYDNDPIATLIAPSLTTIDPQPEQIAIAAVDLLMEMIEPDDGVRPSPRIRAVEPRLVVRESA